MRAFLGILLVYLQALLLAGTSPVGAGQVAHQNQLLDSLIPHIHFVSGQAIQPGAIPSVAATSDRPERPAVGAGTGAAAATAGLVLTPPLPRFRIAVPPTDEARQLNPAEMTPPMD